MINAKNFPDLLSFLGFAQQGNIWTKSIYQFELKVDFKSQKLIYPNGIECGRETTLNFSANENFVVFECVHNLLNSGYLPEHIILEPTIPGGRGESSAFGDILVKNNNHQAYLLIECKTTDNKNSEFEKEWKKMLKNGGQLFNYFNTYRSCEYLCLYTCDFQNNQIEHLYHLISMTDNKKYLEDNDGLLNFESVKLNDGGKDEYFKVWQNTYQNDYISHNLFESEIFNIGNRPYNLDDLKFVGESTIQKKYHQFATIMRKYNVSGRENAFDKLVNLFLCKVVDEKNNPDNLKVYWKGASSDNHFDLQDRLQKLYKDGMEEFLNEPVTYIEESEIKNAFKWLKEKEDETRNTILEYFKQLKFYSNNAFAFIDVHNKDLFVQNAIILKEVVQMLQDIRLKNEDEQHQFLGDLFEGFLDAGVKQSEGQFFTPMPIVKFLISSLPLNQLIDNENIPKVIDYACGAGHFLTEYASQIKELIGTEKQDNLKFYYGNIFGIEKEYRLSKVAKVSAFMYGQDDIKIVYADALAKSIISNSKFQINDGEFSLLVANPPYSVKGFLTTLSDEDKKSFELYQELNEESFNSIEVFFIEKAKQLLKSGGIGAIILPSSVLTNGNIYIKCREIILKYFDIIAIAEFGSGTFGKTGTNTATLFLRRKEHKPDIANHYANRVKEWFSGEFDTEIELIFSDGHLLEKYCIHCGFNLVEYKNFLTNQSFEIFENELFKEYRQEFDASSELKELKKKKYFKELSDDDKAIKLHNEFLLFVKNKESEKVYFYLMALDNKQEVLIIKSPADSKANKNFLGYEWSSAKGNEGIKYIGTTTQNDNDTPNLNQGIYKIKTPLFNPNNLMDNSKINHLIRERFLGNKIMISEQNSEFVSLLPLTQMIDFGRTSFDKAIRTSIQKRMEIVSKYPLVKLGSIAEISRGASPRPIDNYLTENENGINWIKIGDVSPNDKYITQTKQKITQEGANKSKFVNIGDFIISNSMSAGRPYILKIQGCIHDGWLLMSNISNEINKDYLYYVLTSDNLQEQFSSNAVGGVVKNLNTSRVAEVKIPLPSLNIQEEIIKECQKIDEEYENSRMKIEEYRNKIADIFNQLEVVISGGGQTLVKIKDMCLLLKRGKSAKYGNSSIQIIKSGQARGYEKFDFKESYFVDGTFVLDERQLQKGDILINSTGVGTAGRITLFNLDGVFVVDSHITIFRPNTNKVLPKFALYSLAHIGFDTIEKMANGASGQIELNLSTIGNISFALPDIPEQQKIVTQIQHLESEIKKAEQIMNESSDKKKVILDKYLS